MVWKFYDYVDGGVNVMQAWLSTLGSDEKAARAKLHEMVLNQEQVEILKRPTVGKLEDDCEDLYELIFYANGNPYRPIFCIGPGQRELTLLVGATKRRNKEWIPRNACLLARRRKALIGRREHVTPHDHS